MKLLSCPCKILFEIKGMQDEAIYLKDSQYRDVIISNIKQVFGEDKVYLESEHIISKTMKDLKELKRLILADGIIDEQEVIQLREILYEDGIIDKEEAEFLFELNDAVSGKNNDPSWQTLFVDAITSFLLDDEKSPGEVDDEEAKWLLNKLQADGKIDSIEQALLVNLKNKAKKIPKSILDIG